MEGKGTELYRTLAKRFSALCGVPVTIVDAEDRRILFTENRADNFFCEKCPNRCRLLATMLYGCNEARRWSGRYIYYCPIGLVFSAVTIPETDHTVVAGPVVMGEMQDTLLDLPEHIDREQISALHTCSANMLSHMASVLEMSVYGLRYRPNAAAYDRNIIPGEETETGESAEQYISFPYMSELEEALRRAVSNQEKAKAREALNQLLRYVYSPHPDRFALIRSRAIQLVYLLSKITAAGEGSEKETDVYRRIYIPALKKTPSLEEMDVTMAEVLHHFVDYTFDFTQIKHSDTIYRVMEYIKSNYSRKITLEEIASCVYLSGSHISGMFRKETGQTISAYINHVRIEKSKSLLKQAGIPIADIAALCGFEDQSYFTRVFKKQTGISPKRYRDNALGQEALTGEPKPGRP